MTREIGFRVWDTNAKDWLFKELPMFGSDMALEEWEGYAWLHRDRYVLMQRTDLKDRNNTWIYEGDIVRHNINTYYECRWNSFRSEFAWYSAWGEYLFPIGDLRTGLDVVGNIYQTPELIQQDYPAPGVKEESEDKPAA